MRLCMVFSSLFWRKVHFHHYFNRGWPLKWIPDTIVICNFLNLSIYESCYVLVISIITFLKEYLKLRICDKIYFFSRCESKSWVSFTHIDDQATAFTIYILSAYWAAATMTSTGYGDITAKSSLEEIIVLFVLIIGLLMYGYCLSSIAAILTNKLSAKQVQSLSVLEH